MNRKELISWLEKRVIEVGECWEWQHSAISGTRPYVTRDKQRIPVRRTIAQVFGMYEPGHVQTTSCGNPLCVNPKHVLSMSKSDHMKIAGGKGGSDPKRLVTIQTLQQFNRKLSDEQVAQIRASDESSRVLGERFGVSRALVCRVRRLECRRHLNNPFAGLGARL